ncbi:MAG: hypothetical protein EBQ51_01475, partial [Verrucomicrobia bacterium]|nr:hypothetical protein [Verrucomicrobiota bacterium]
RQAKDPPSLERTFSKIGLMPTYRIWHIKSEKGEKKVILASEKGIWLVVAWVSWVENQSPMLFC